MMSDLSADIDKRKATGLYRSRHLLASPQGPQVIIDGQQYINFSSNDYLGLANHPTLKERMINAVKEYGLGAASSTPA